MSVRQVILGLGSNQNPLANFRRCLTALEARFGEIRASTVYQSADVTLPNADTLSDSHAAAFPGPIFHNMAVAFASDAAPAEIKAWCKAQERVQGRLPKSAGARTHPIDIDLLAVGDLCGEFAGNDGQAIPLPHGDILRHAFVLGPLAELAPDARHPRTDVTYAELWKSAPATASRRLTPICWPSSAPL